MVSMRLVRALAIPCALTASIAASVLVPAPVALADPAQDARVDALIQQRLVNPRIGSDVGMIVIDAASGAVVSAHDPDASMLPASNMKIVTAVDILALRDAESRFVTRVVAGATPGDVIIEGAGDPLLTSENLQHLAVRTSRQLSPGTEVVLHVDDDLFPATGRAPGWTPSYLPYSAAAVESLARLGDYSRDPSTNAAKVFAQRLRSRGFTVRLGDYADAAAGATVLAEAKGHTVGEAVHVMLSRSENNVAEVLYRHVAVAAGIEATWAGAQQAAERTLSRLGIDPAGMALLDGSGLSRKDRLSPRFLAEVLRVARVTRPERFSTMFEDSALPVSGRTGTLATAYGRYVTKHARCAQGDVRAKTGSLFDTIALSGVATTATGDERLFSILVNDRPQRYSALSTRQALDGLTATVTGCWD